MATPMFLPGESQGRRSLVGCSPWGRTELGMTEATQQQQQPLERIGFPDSSAGKESACKAGDPGLIPRSGRSTGEEKGYPLQYSWPSPVAEMVKNLPTMQETWFRSLSWEDTLEKGMAIHSSILAWRIPWTVQSMGSQRVGQDQVTFTFTHSWWERHGVVSCFRRQSSSSSSDYTESYHLSHKFHPQVYTQEK